MHKIKVCPHHFFWLAILITVYAMFGYAYSLTHLYEQKTLVGDLGAFNQVMHNIITRGVPFSTLTPFLLEQNWFGFHFSPIFYVLAPFIRVIPTSGSVASGAGYWPESGRMAGLSMRVPIRCDVASRPFMGGGLSIQSICTQRAGMGFS